MFPFFANNRFTSWVSYLIMVALAFCFLGGDILLASAPSAISQHQEQEETPEEKDKEKEVEDTLEELFSEHQQQTRRERAKLTAILRLNQTKRPHLPTSSRPGHSLFHQHLGAGISQRC